MKKENTSNAKFWLFISMCFLALIAGISVFITSRSSTSKNADVQKRSVTLTDAGFDTPVTFQAECSEEDYLKYLDILKTTFQDYNKLFDIYHEYEGINNVYTLNEKAAYEAVEVDPEIIDCIQQSMKANQVNQKFDIAEGKLLSLWHDARESDSPYLPDAQAISEAKVHTDVSGVIIDGNKISFKDDTVQLDLGAIAKGYTAEKAKEKLEEAGLDNGFINAGGNVVLIGNKKDGSEWVVGIQKPDSADSLVRYKTSTPTCLVTSGDYQRYMTIDGKRYSHIIDPETGYPAEYVRSVTVITPDSTWADAMSTALFCMSVQDGMQVCKEQNLEAVWFT
ncbi:MAG: FAD:protein FMN transferase, partial [Ileibacterium sp.]|nr:FAD:protein FMN transferase [Ileibacterium sp.]